MNGVLEGKAATSCPVSTCNTGIWDTRTWNEVDNVVLLWATSGLA